MSGRDDQRSHAPATVAAAAAVAVGLAVVQFRAARPTLPDSLDDGPVGLALALRRLPVTGRVLFVTAHPDDEDNAVLLALGRGRGMDVGLLTLTRGESGQNVVGPEDGEALGALREAELAAIHRTDGVRQFFTRARDFGFSVSVGETLARWGDDVLDDVVRVVRSFQPDVIVALPLDGPGHQHHAASARLARQAFQAAADPSRFPEQADAGLRPWAAVRLYQGGLAGAAPPFPLEGTAVVETQRFDPALGMTWAALGGLLRGLHRSQGLAASDRPPRRAARFALVASRDGGGRPGADLLDRVDVSLTGLRRLMPGGTLPPAIEASLARLDASVRRARQKSQPRAPWRALPELREGLAQLREVRAPSELLDRLEGKAADIERALAMAQGLGLSVSAPAEVVTGRAFRLTTRVVNRGREPVEIRSVRVLAPAAWQVERVAEGIGQLPPGGALECADVGQATEEGPAVLSVRLDYAAGGVTASLDRALAVAVVPPVSVQVEPAVVLWPANAAGSRDVGVRIVSRVVATARVSLDVPPGWSASPDAATVVLDAAADAVTRFRLTATDGAAAGDVAAAVVVEGRDVRTTEVRIRHDHVEPTRVLRPATARLVVLDVRVDAGGRVGHLSVGRDPVPDALRALGVPVTRLGRGDLERGALESYSTIVVAPRAYDLRADLRSRHGRLMRWVRGGGRLLVLRHAGTDDAFPFAPFPARLSASRVTDETAPITVLAPRSPLVTQPNGLSASDWEGWVEERGAGLLETGDPRYVDVLASTDPFPENPGRKTGLLVTAQVGSGSWTYVGLALSEQLAAGVPGAYRLLANLVGRRGAARMVDSNAR
jgi:LmbE family N-acetylglucosaminyl deacetylase